MSSLRLYDGDMNVILSLMHAMNKRFLELESGTWNVRTLLVLVMLSCQATGTADQANRVTPGSGPFNLISHLLALVWQPPIT